MRNGPFEDVPFVAEQPSLEQRFSQSRSVDIATHETFCNISDFYYTNFPGAENTMKQRELQ